MVKTNGRFPCPVNFLLLSGAWFCSCGVFSFEGPTIFTWFLSRQADFFQQGKGSQRLGQVWFHVFVPRGPGITHVKLVDAILWKKSVSMLLCSFRGVRQCQCVALETWYWKMDLVLVVSHPGISKCLVKR